MSSEAGRRLKDHEEEARIVAEIQRVGRGTDPFASAVRATRMPMVITDPNQPDNPIVFVNAAFMKLTGYDRAEILGKNCRFLQGPDTSREDVAALASAIFDRRPIELDLLNHRKDGSTFWNRVLVSPVFDDDGDLTYFFASQMDVTLERERLARLETERLDLETEVARRDAELMASEQRLSFALKAGRMGSWSLEVQSMRMVASEGCKENFGRHPAEPFTYVDLMAAVHPDDRERRDAAVDASIRDGSPLDVEYRLLTPTGEERWVQIRGQANYSADGSPLSLIGVSQDITDRKRIEEHRQMLADELSHRVKNSLTMIQAVISQTLRRSGTIEEVGQTLQARIGAMASANDLLVEQRWEGTSLRALLQRTLAPFGAGQATSFRLSGPEVEIPPAVASAVALSLHEMATNASKYGALSVQTGIVHLGWTVELAETGPVLSLQWIEQGGPLVSAPTRTGFGSKLIERLLPGHDGNRSTITYAPGGVRLDAVFALGAVDQQPSTD